jgi:hypothetical protein
MVRNILTAILTATLVAAPAAQAHNAGATGQQESGTVVTNAPSPNGPDDCFQGYPRRAYVISQGVVNGPLGGVFAVDKSTWGGKFALKVDGGLAGTEDLDLFYYSDMGDFMSDPSLNSPVIVGTYAKRKAGGEAGVVPKTSTYALVCLLPTTGALAQWSYKAAPPAKK